MTTSARFPIPERDTCPFCENLAGRHPCAFVAHTPTLAAFINPRQYGKGALLLVPRRHVPTVLDLNSDEAAALMPEAVRLTHAIQGAFAPTGFNLFQNNGISAGQSVAHYHLHIVPNYRAAATNELFSHVNFPSTPIDERFALAEEIKRHL